MARVRKIVGKTVYLSPVEMADAPKFYEWMNDMDVTDFTGATQRMYALPNEESWIQSITDNHEYVFSICLKEDDTLIGNISLMKIENINQTCELGIMIGDPSKRNQGFGTEAILLLLDYAFSYLNMHTIYLDYLFVNVRARRCYDKCGFQFVGKKRECIFLNGKYYDKGIMDITAEEFYQKKKENGEEYIQNKNVK